MKILHHRFTFCPVGQGLFTHGLLYHSRRDRPFVWFYDCGTSSRFSILQDQIDQFTEMIADKTIDLGMLSHYDQDHVNGVVQLVKKCKIKTLVLPYLYPSQRCLLLANAAGKARWYQQFLQSPASYLLQEAGENIEQIILITGGEGEPPPEPGDGGADLDQGDGIQWPRPDPEKHMRRKKSRDPDEPVDGFSQEHDSDLEGKASFQTLDSQQPLSYFGLWEFCFYNRPQNVDDLKQWWNDAEPIWRNFQQSPKKISDYDELINGMKRTLTENRHLPRSKFNANEVSLLVYMGPVPDRLHRIHRLHGSHQWHCNVAFNSFPLSWQHGRRWIDYGPDDAFFPWPHGAYDSTLPQDAGYLFTGDITMDASVSLMIQNDFLGKSRWERLGYLQVPHHGARRSWRPDVYRHWHHRYSVFSARGAGSGYGHPHQEVVEDLEGHGPIQVNSKQGLLGGGSYRFR